MPQQTTQTKRERREAAREQRLERERSAAAADARRKRLFTLGGLLVAAAVIIVAAIAISSGGGSGKKTAATGGKVAGAGASLFAGIPQSGVTVGRPDAPVTLIEFADPQCPFCKDYTLNEMPAVVQKYVRTGKLKMELRLMTFIGDDSVTGARALEAAGLQNKLWDAADLFYKNQGEENSGYVTEAFLKKVLGGVPGLDVTRALSEASSSSKVTQALGETSTLASRYGVNSTPTAVIGPTNGTLKKDPEQTLTAAGIGKLVEAALKQAQ